MKKVAATSGQSVSLAALVFALGITRVGSGAGSDNVLNFYSRSSSNECSLTMNGATSQSKNTSFVLRCKKKMHRRKTFFDVSYGDSGSTPQLSPDGPDETSWSLPCATLRRSCFRFHRGAFCHEAWAVASRRRRNRRSPVRAVRAKAADATPAGHRR